MKDRILVVDDEPAILVTLKEILQLNGYEVETASSGAEALRKLDGSMFHLVLTDMKMETNDAGFTVTRAAKRQRYQPSVVILTAYPMLAAKWQAQGADALFDKPTRTEELLRQIKALLEHRGKPHPARSD